MNGYFLGGAAEGMNAAVKNIQGQQQIDNNYDISQRTLQLQQQAQEGVQKRFDTTRNDTILNQGVKDLTDTIDQLKANGQTPQQILKAVSPWIDQIKAFSKRTGGDPVATVDIPVQAKLAGPSFDPTAVASLITGSADKYGVPQEILHNTLKAESGFNPNAVNKKSGASGIAQFTPGTAQARGVNPMNPDSAIPGAASYLADLSKQFGGNWGLASAAYNWGPGNVQKWIQAGADPAKVPKETSDYVQSVTGKTMQEWTQPGSTEQQTPQSQTPNQPAPQTQPQADPERVRQIVLALHNPNTDKNVKAALSTILGQIANPAGNVEIKTVKDENGNEHVLFVDKVNRTITDQNGNPYVIPTGGESDASTIAKAIAEGRQPPVLTGLYRKSAAVRAQLEKNGIDLSQLDLQYKSAVKQVQSLNGPQMVRYAGLAKSVINTIDEVKSLSAEMKNSGVPLFNRAKLQTFIQTQGNSSSGQLAVRYLAGVNTLKEEFANLAQGGYAPTEAAWKLADQQINGDFGQQQMDAALTEVQRLLRYRLNGIPNFNTLGPGGQNRYVNDAAGNGGHSAPPAPTTPPTNWQTYFGAQ